MKQVTVMIEATIDVPDSTDPEDVWILVDAWTQFGSPREALETAIDGSDHDGWGLVYFDAIEVRS